MNTQETTLNDRTLASSAAARLVPKTPAISIALYVTSILGILFSVVMVFAGSDARGSESDRMVFSVAEGIASSIALIAIGVIVDKLERVRFYLERR